MDLHTSEASSKRNNPAKALLALFLSLVLAFGLLPANLAWADDEGVGDAENSWRYDDGELVSNPNTEGTSPSDSVTVLASTPSHWVKEGSVYTTTLGGKTMTVTDAKALGVDVSHHQGTIDWKKAKVDGVDYAIIRVSQSADGLSKFNADKQFTNNIKGCMAAGIPFGVYVYSMAKNASEAKKEAAYTIKMMKAVGATPSKTKYPVYIDMEDKTQLAVGKAKLADIATTFCNYVKGQGYTPGVYANRSWFKNYLTDPCFEKWTRWIAQYPSQGKLDAVCSDSNGQPYMGSYGMWQCMSSGQVNGIKGRVDMNFWYGSTKKAKTVVAEPFVLTRYSSPGSIKIRSSFDFVGVLSSNSKLARVTASIVDSNGKVVQSKAATPNATTFSLYNSAIDNGLEVDKLKVGTYYYQVTAKDANDTKRVLREAFTVYPYTTHFTKVTPKKNSVALKWEKRTYQVTSYQIRWSTNKSMKNAKTKTYKKAKTTAKSIKNLKSKKTYYVQIRTYKKVDGKKIYGQWSSKVKVKTK